MLGRPLKRPRNKHIAIFDKKNIFKKFQLYFFQFLVIKTLDPDPDSLEMLDPDPDSVNRNPQHCFLFKNLVTRKRQKGHLNTVQYTVGGTVRYLFIW